MNKIALMAYVIGCVGVMGLTMIVAMADQNEATYREAEVLDIPQLIEIYDKGLNRGLWCDLPNHNITSFELLAEWEELNDKYGDNFIASVGLNDGNIQSLSIAWVEDSTLVVKAMLFDTDLPSDDWLEIVHKHVNWSANWGQSRGAKKMSTNVVDGDWVHAYVTEILYPHGGRHTGDTTYEIDLIDFFDIDVNYSQELEYETPQPDGVSVEVPLFPENYDEIIDANTLLSDGEFWVFQEAIAYEENGTWHLIDVNVSKHSGGSWYFPWLDLYVSDDGYIVYDGVRIELESIYTNTGYEYTPSFYTSSGIGLIGREPRRQRVKVIEDYDTITFVDVVPDLIDYQIKIKRGGFSINTIIKKNPTDSATISTSDVFKDRLYVKYKVTSTVEDFDRMRKKLRESFTGIDGDGREFEIDKQITDDFLEKSIVESIPLGFLTNDRTKYPVILDPIVDVNPSEDLYFIDHGDNDGHWTQKFNQSGIIDYIGGDTSMITSATFWLYFYNINKDYDADVFRGIVHENWTESENCNDIFIGGDWNYNAADFATFSLIEDDIGWKSVDVLTMVTNSINENNETITFYMPMDGASYCESANTQNDYAYFKSKTYSTGKTIWAKASESSTPPILRISMKDKYHVLFSPNTYIKYSKNTLLKIWGEI